MRYAQNFLVHGTKAKWWEQRNGTTEERKKNDEWTKRWRKKKQYTNLVIAFSAYTKPRMNGWLAKDAHNSHFIFQSWQYPKLCRIIWRRNYLNARKFRRKYNFYLLNKYLEFYNFFEHFLNNYYKKTTFFLHRRKTN